MRESNLGLNVIQDNMNLREGLPVKVFEYIVNGLPTIVSDFQEWRGIFQNHVYYVEPNNPEQIALSIKRIMNDYQQISADVKKSKSFIINNYSWQTEISKLRNLYTKLLSLQSN
jgi:glycosyltransferase involved in cell wall biosynthesis